MTHIYGELVDEALSPPYDPTEDRELIEMIGARLVKIDPECDAEPWVDEYPTPTWLLLVAGDPGDEPNEDWVDVHFDIAPSETFDGTDEGFNIGWLASTPGGRILAQCMPHNYTDRVWTRDRDELWERAEGALNALEEWVEEKGWEDG